MRLLLLGGTFNPVHIGHLILAEEVRCEFGYDLALLVPSARPPHKAVEGEPGPEERLAMLRLAIAGNPSLAVDDCELSRFGPSYTIDTIRGLGVRYAFEGKPGLVIGDDLAPGFSSWKDPSPLATEADLIVARRTGACFELGYPHRLATNRLIPVSSSEIRQRLARGLSIRYLVPETVFAYIQAKGLYVDR